MESIFRVEDMIGVAGNDWVANDWVAEFEYTFLMNQFEIGKQRDVFMYKDTFPREEEMPENFVVGNPRITYRGRDCTLFSKTYSRKSDELDLSRNMDEAEIFMRGFLHPFGSMARDIENDLLSMVLESNVNFQEDYLNTTIALFSFPHERIAEGEITESGLVSYNNFFITVSRVEYKWDISFRLDMKLVAIIF